MTMYSNSAEGGTSGAAVTIANSGGTSGTAWGGTSGVTYDSTHPAHGSLAYKVTAPGTGAANLFWDTDVQQVVARRFYVWIDTLPSVDCWLARGTASGTGVDFVAITAAGKLKLIGVGGSNVWTATNNFPTGQIIRVEQWVDAGTSTTTGQAQIAYYLCDSTTAVEDSTLLTGKNFGGTAPTRASFGKLDANNVTSNIWLDDIAVSTGAGSFIGPAVTAPTVTAKAVTSNLVKIDGTTSAGTGLTYTLTPLSGETGTIITGPTAGIWYVPQPTSTEAVYTITVTSGGTSDSTNVTLEPATSNTSMRYYDGTNVVTL